MGELIIFYPKEMWILIKTIFRIICKEGCYSGDGEKWLM